MKTLEEIEKEGMNSRALGNGLFENPYLKVANCPGQTGDSIATWEAKYTAWQDGWIKEDAVRR